MRLSSLLLIFGFCPTLFGQPTLSLQNTLSGGSLPGAATQNLVFRIDSPNGANDLSYASILINNNNSPVYGCQLTYYPAYNSLYFVPSYGATPVGATPGQAGQGPIGGVHCILDPQASSAAFNGNGVTLTLALTLQPSARGTQNIYAYVYDNEGGLNANYWSSLATWLAFGEITTNPPSVSMAQPPVAQGAATQPNQVLHYKLSDGNGYTYISQPIGQLGADATQQNTPCYFSVSLGSNVLVLYSIANGAWTYQGYGYIGTSYTSSGTGIIGTPGQCSIDIANSKVHANPNPSLPDPDTNTGSYPDLYLDLATSFQSPSSLPLNVFLSALDLAYRSTPLTIVGAWTAGGASEAVSTPDVAAPPGAIHAGASYTFTASATSTLGHAVQYQFNWGDETSSDWQGSTTASHSWATARTVSITVQARCAADATVLSANSGPLTVTVTLAPPAQVTLTSPATTTAGVGVQPVLDWSLSAGATAYDLYLGTTLPPPPFTQNVTGPPYHVPIALSGNTAYYWNVVAKNSAGPADASVTWQFTTIATLPDQVTLSAPAYGATGLSVPVALSWSVSARATSYDLYFGGSLTPPLYAADVSETGFNISAPLTPGATYYWKVIAKNSYGQGLPSSVFQFTAATVSSLTLSPGTVSLLGAGGNGAIALTAPGGVSWTAVSSDSSWLTVTTASGNGSQNIIYQAASNSAGNLGRSATITILSGSGNAVATINEAALVAGSPSVALLNPLTGLTLPSAATQTLSFRVESPNGPGYLDRVHISVGKMVDDVPGCRVDYYPAYGMLYLLTATNVGGAYIIGAGGQTPAAGVFCSLDAQASSAVFDNTGVTVNLALTLQPSARGSFLVYGFAIDKAQAYNALYYNALATWAAYNELSPLPPTVSLVPPPSAQLSQTLHYKLSDGNGYTFLRSPVTGTLDKNGTNQNPPCYFQLDPNTKWLSLYSLPDWTVLGDGTVGESAKVIGAPGKCWIDLANSRVHVNPNPLLPDPDPNAALYTDLYVDFATSFETAAPLPLNVYLSVYDLKWNSAWNVQVGTWNPPPPSPVTLTAPLDGAENQPLTPTLAWTAGAGAAPTSYDVYMGAGAATPTLVATVLSPPYAPTSPLAAGVNYSWYVVAKNAGGSGQAPPARHFSTVPPSDFTVTLTSSASSTVLVGQSAPYTLSLTPLNGFSGQVSFAITGLPASGTYSAPPVTGSGGTTVNASSGVEGTFPLTITASSAGLSAKTISVTMVVQDFTITADQPPKLTCTGMAQSTTALIHVSGSYTGPIYVSTAPGVFNLQPAGVATAEVQGNPMSVGGPAATATLKVTTSAPSCSPVSYYLQINASTGLGGAWRSVPALAVPFNTAVPPALTVTSAHSGNFSQGQQGRYTVIVANRAGAGITSGLVTVMDTMPGKLTLAYMSGVGWDCSANTCTRSDSLAAGASYPPISVVVNVASDAALPQVNTVNLSGGGSASGQALDTTFVSSGPIFTVTTSPVEGLTVGVDGTSCPSPCTFQWDPGSAHSLSVPAIQSDPISGNEYLFTGWDDDPAAALQRTVVAAVANTHFTAHVNMPSFDITLSRSSVQITPPQDAQASTAGWVASLNATVCRLNYLPGGAAANATIYPVNLPPGITMNVADQKLNNPNSSTNVTFSHSYSFPVTTCEVEKVTFVAGKDAALTLANTTIQLSSGANAMVSINTTSCVSYPCGCAWASHDVYSYANGNAYALFDTWLDGQAPGVASTMTVQALSPTLTVPAGGTYGGANGTLQTGTGHSIGRYPTGTSNFNYNDPDKGFGSYIGRFTTHVTSTDSRCESPQEFSWAFLRGPIGPPNITGIYQNRTSAVPGQTLTGVRVDGGWLTFPNGTTTVTTARMIDTNKAAVLGVTVTLTGASGTGALVNITVGTSTAPGAYRLALTALGKEVSTPFTVLGPPVLTFDQSKIIIGAGSQVSVTVSNTNAQGGHYTWELIGDDPAIGTLLPQPPNCQETCTVGIQGVKGGRATIRVHFLADIDEHELTFADVPLVVIEITAFQAEIPNHVGVASTIVTSSTVLPSGPLGWEYQMLFSLLYDTHRVVLIQGSVEAITLRVTSKPPATDPDVVSAIRFDVIRATDDSPVLKVLKEKPTITQGTAQGTIAPDATGSFQLIAFVDGNGNNTRDDDETGMVLPAVFVRATLNKNNSKTYTENIHSEVQPSDTEDGAVPVVWLSTGSDSPPPTADVPPTNAVLLEGEVNLIGGGSAGLRGLDQVFGSWIQNEVENEVVVGNYQGGHEIHTVFASNTYAATGTLRQTPVFLLDGLLVPVLLNAPLLDGTTHLTSPGPGTGGWSSALSMVRVFKSALQPIPALGERRTYRAVDPPNMMYPLLHPQFVASSLTHLTFGLTFKSFLALWTNTSGGSTQLGDCTSTATPGRPGQCTYGAILAQPWNIGLEYQVDSSGMLTPLGSQVISLGSADVYFNNGF